MALLNRRAVALADYWDELLAARRPGDVLNANSAYWSRLLNDYLAVAIGEAPRGRAANPTERPQ